MARTRSIFVSTVAALALASAATSASAAVIRNGSFEDIVLDWTANPGLVQTPGQYDHLVNGQLVYEFLPKDGSHLGVIQAGEADEEVTIMQTFTTKGGIFSGWAAFSARDGLFLDDDVLYGNDRAFVRLTHNGTVIDLFNSNVAAVGDYGYTPWTQFSIFLDAGDYMLEAGVVNPYDNLNASILVVDAFNLAEVPEPSTWALMIGGFGLAGAALRRRRIAAA